MNIWKIYSLGCVAAILILAAAPYAYSQTPLVNGTGIYLSTGETWTFYQGYSFTLKSVNKDRGWVQLKLNNTVVKSAILSPGDTFYYNITTNNSNADNSINKSYTNNSNTNNSNNTYTLFSLKVSGVYSGEDKDIVTYYPVFQYHNPNLPEATPIPVPDSTENASTGPSPGATRNTPGPQVVTTAIIICLCTILIRCLRTKM